MLKDHPDAWLYAAIALPVALLFAFVTPPFQTPDEVAHYWRASAIASGELRAPMVNGRPGAVIPAANRDLVAALWMELAGTPTKYDRSKLQNARQLRTSSETVRVLFPAFYTPVPYLPQASALLVGRWLDARPLFAFYAGRLANAIAGVLLIVFAMRLLPSAAWIFGGIGLTPMFLFLAGSYSADVVTIGLAFCTVAAALRIGRSPKSRGRAALPIVASLLALAKPGYALITLVSWTRVRVRTERALIAITMVGVLIGGWLGAAQAKAAYYPMRNDVVTDATRQLRHVTDAPLQFLRVTSAHYAEFWYQYLTEMVGRLGWLDVGLPQVVFYSYLALFLYVALTVSLPIDVWDRVVLLAVFIGTLIVLALAQYLIWTSLGATSIGGLQGRYFLPVAPVALLVFATKRLPLWRPAIAIIAIAGNCTALVMVAQRYYAF
jgi:uncharacterized membrane protein